MEKSKLIRVNNKLKVNWENIIILPEFINYIGLEKLTELSIISKLTRTKFKPKIFEDIKFDGNQFENYFNNEENLLKGYFEYEPYYSSFYSDKGFDKYQYKDLKIDSALQEFKDQLNGMKPFVKYFHLSFSLKVGFYLFPLLNMFENLVMLELEHCTVPLSEFIKLDNFFPNLKTLEISNSSFVKLPTEKLTLENTEWPKKLKKFSIIACKLYSNEKLLNPYNFLFDQYFLNLTGQFLIPKKPIPSLIDFKYLSDEGFPAGLDEFLYNNPQLECLNLDLSCLDSLYMSIIANTLKLNRLELIIESGRIQSFKIPKLPTINQLQFYTSNPEHYLTIQKFCLSCPNLEELNFIIAEMNCEEAEYIMEGAFEYTIPRCNNLKVLSLILLGEYYVPFNPSKLNQVEKLIVEAPIDTLYNIDFSTVNSLKQIEFKFLESDNNSNSNNNGYNFEIGNEFDDEDEDFIDDCVVNIRKFKKKFDNINNWKFNFSDDGVKGKRV